MQSLVPAAESLVRKWTLLETWMWSRHFGVLGAKDDRGACFEKQTSKSTHARMQAATSKEVTIPIRTQHFYLERHDMGIFDKAQKRKKRLLKKRENVQRAKKKELNAQTELQRNILATLIMKDEMIFSPERYWDLLQELGGEEPTPIEYDSTEYWVIVSQLRKLSAWVRNMDPKGRQWELSLDYCLRVRKQVAQGELPAVSLWLEAAVVTATGKTLGESSDADNDIRRDTDPAAAG